MAGRGQRFALSRAAVLSMMTGAGCASLGIVHFTGRMSAETSAKTTSEESNETHERIVTREELLQHRSESSLWVTYGGSVYDVTEFVKKHPGGKDAILSAGGQDLAAFWERYPIHYQKMSTMDVLERHKIGVLEEIPENEVSVSTPTPKELLESSASMSRQRHWKDTLGLVGVGIVGPLWSLLRVLLRFIGIFFPGTVDAIADRYLPVSLPSYGSSRPLRRGGRVAVIGGGIAGVGCAYVLSKDGYEVTIFESRDQLGGNAQVGTFLSRDGKREVKQDLSVLYWCPEYYRSYERFLKDIGIEAETISVPYVLMTNRFEGRPQYFTPKGTSLHSELDDHALETYFAEDFEKYDRMIAFCRKMSRYFSDDSKSFYKNSGIIARLNPLNFISNRTLARRFGISDDFYETIFVPFQGFQFSTVKVADIPAVALPILDDIVPLTRSRTHRSWGVGNSQRVFTTATRDVSVRLGERVLAVRFDAERKEHVVITTFDKAPDAEICEDDVARKDGDRFDRVVFAVSNAHAVCNILGPRRGSYEASILDAVNYHDQISRGDWKDWLCSPVHQDVAIVPPEHRDTIMDKAGFFVDHDVKSGNIEYHHVLGSWSPSAIAAGERKHAMFMSQCLHEHRTLDPELVRSSFSAPRAHPDLSFKNMAITQMLHLIQGRRGVYYAGNYTAPGNGHDLSFLSGVVVATAIGATYPFAEDPACVRDWQMMRSFMGF